MYTNGGVERHSSDLVVNNPMHISDLNRGDVVLLPLYGECIVIRSAFFDPALNREFISLLLVHKAGELRLICTRNMCFHYVGLDLDYK